MFHDIAGHEDLTDGIIGCGIRVHETLGPGLLESVYRACMIIELQASGYQVDASRRIPVQYRGQNVGAVFCPDLIVNETVVVAPIEPRRPGAASVGLTYMSAS